MRLLGSFLRRVIKNGRLTLVDHTGRLHGYGSGLDGPHVAIRLHDRAVAREILLDPELAAPRAAIDGRLTFEQGSRIYDLVGLFSANRRRIATHPIQRAMRRIRGRGPARALDPLAPVADSATGEPIPEAFFRLWLDPTLTFSCAYFSRPDVSLAQAQAAKIRRITAKLALTPETSVVEIGSGWGSLAVHLAQTRGASVTAIARSGEQIEAGRRRARAAGVEERVSFVDTDYRAFAGQFDRVVSVGLLGRLGAADLHDYLQAIRRLLRPGGFALVQGTCRMGPPGATAPILSRVVAPGSSIPSLSEVFREVEAARLWCGDCESWRVHDRLTFEHWRRAYEARRGEAVKLVGERFCRLWDFTLAALEYGARDGAIFTVQLLLGESRDAVPITREYVAAGEAELLAPRLA
jgi:cyclopropane-fatty-acyl-phospholipid synthase